MPRLLSAAPRGLTRRQGLRLGLAAGLLAGAAYPFGRWSHLGAAQALPLRTLQFPRDHGSHPDFQTEWWYVTGQLETAPGQPAYGFQVTFFRSRVASTQTLDSAFAAKQLLFAHVAVTDVAAGRLHHDQRMARAGHGLAEASEHNMDVFIGPWRLASDAAGRHRARIEGDAIGLDLMFEDSQPLLLQGDQGLSRKGPLPEQASYYYSRPQLRVQGSLRVGGARAVQVKGTAWLDHEWSQALLARDAEGWDWMGMNLHDGSALTAFQLRRADGTALWTGGSWRPAGRPARIFAPGELMWQPGRIWTSARSGARYPVEWTVATPAGRFGVQALVDDQELDASASTGGIYWEGLSRLTRDGQAAGAGYLEMTGYHSPLRVR